MELRSARFSLKVVSFVTLFCALTSSTLFAEYGNFLIAEEPTGPRISAMGGAGTALAGGSFGSYNPASPAFAPAPFVGVEYGTQPGGLSKSGLETAWMFPHWFVGASLHAQTTDFPLTDQRSDPAIAPFQLSSNQALQATITGGFVVGRFASGYSLDYFQENIADYAHHALTFCPGVMYRLVPDKISVGASLLHYLWLDTVQGPWYKAPRDWYELARGVMPRYARAGVAWSDTLRQATLPFTVATDIVYSDIYERVMVPVGVEAWVLPYLAARAGVRINHPTEIAHFGVGVRMSSLAFDFDYGISRLVEKGETEAKWLCGLTYALHTTKPVTGEPPAPPKASAEKQTPVAPVPVAPPAVESVKQAAPPVPAADSAQRSPAVDTTGSPAASPVVHPDSVSLVPKALPDAGAAVVPAAALQDSLRAPAQVKDTVKK